jgi:hypothetical protein
MSAKARAPKSVILSEAEGPLIIPQGILSSGKITETEERLVWSTSQALVSMLIQPAEFLDIRNV